MDIHDKGDGGYGHKFDAEYIEIANYSVRSMRSTILELEYKKMRLSYVDGFSQGVDKVIHLLKHNVTELEEEIRGLQAND